jgi:hypothetical protein
MRYDTLFFVKISKQFARSGFCTAIVILWILSRGIQPRCAESFRNVIIIIISFEQNIMKLKNKKQTLGFFKYARLLYLRTNQRRFQFLILCPCFVRYPPFSAWLPYLKE